MYCDPRITFETDIAGYPTGTPFLLYKYAGVGINER